MNIAKFYENSIFSAPMFTKNRMHDLYRRSCSARIFNRESISDAAEERDGGKETKMTRSLSIDSVHMHLMNRRPKIENLASTASVTTKTRYEFMKNHYSPQKLILRVSMNSRLCGKLERTW